jgi:hypothetical protein
VLYLGKFVNRSERAMYITEFLNKIDLKIKVLKYKDDSALLGKKEK